MDSHSVASPGKKHTTFVEKPKGLLLTHADMDVRAPSDKSVFAFLFVYIEIALFYRYINYYRIMVREWYASRYQSFNRLWIDAGDTGCLVYNFSSL